MSYTGDFAIRESETGVLLLFVVPVGLAGPRTVQAGDQ
jgi:hypothetical protein